MKGLNLLVCGASGRMNSAVLRLARADRRFATVTAVPSDRSAAGFREALAAADIAVDFSVPKAAVAFARACAALKKPYVTGTTGLSARQNAELARLAKRIPLFYAPNMSPGMNLMFHLARVAAEALPDYDAALYEIHHTRKKDAPSGSAKRLAQAVLAARPGRKVQSVSHRAGDVIGEHTLLLAGPQERLEITHRAQTRDVFAAGALDAAVWLRRKRPGLYDFLDLMGIAA